jgi:hypothetical protein
VIDHVPKGRPLAIDAMAQSASPTEPAFISPPAGAPAYHGFVVLNDVSADGFTFGKITDFEAEPCDEGRRLRDGTGRKSGRFGLGSLHKAVFSGGAPAGGAEVGSLGRKFPPANE